MELPFISCIRMKFNIIFFRNSILYFSVFLTTNLRVLNKQSAAVATCSIISKNFPSFEHGWEIQQSFPTDEIARVLK